jgi:hypothetical protein
MLENQGETPYLRGVLDNYVETKCRNGSTRLQQARVCHNEPVGAPAVYPKALKKLVDSGSACQAPSWLC